LIDRYYRGTGMAAVDRVTLFKVVWDTIGTEFGGHHELYERNYAGNHEQIRERRELCAPQRLLDRCVQFVDECLRAPVFDSPFLTDAVSRTRPPPIFFCIDP